MGLLLIGNFTLGQPVELEWSDAVAAVNGIVVMSLNNSSIAFARGLDGATIIFYANAHKSRRMRATWMVTTGSLVAALRVLGLLLKRMVAAS